MVLVVFRGLYSLVKLDKLASGPRATTSRLSNELYFIRPEMLGRNGRILFGST
jgi:hypothetical protein